MIAATAPDWLVLAALAGVLLVAVALDQLRDAGTREAQRRERAESHRRLMGELERQR